MTHLDDRQRRRFLRRLLKATAMAAAAGAVGIGYWDINGPAQDDRTAAPLHIPDFSNGVNGSQMAIARGFDRGAGARAAVKALGGMGGFVQRGDRVVLKVNAAFASPPALGATTHPDMVLAVAGMCFEAGAADVYVTDNPINDPASCFELTGIGPAARQAGARLVLPAPDQFQPYTLDGGQLIRDWPVLGGALAGAQKLIGLAPVKDHHRSGASMTIKNWYGLLGGRRNLFHQRIHTIIAELALMIRPTLVILDGTRTMMANGPTGGSMDDLKDTRTIIAGTDPVAVDSAGALLLDKTAADLPHLAMAEMAGAGTRDFQQLPLIQVQGPA